LVTVAATADHAPHVRLWISLLPYWLRCFT